MAGEEEWNHIVLQTIKEGTQMKDIKLFLTFMVGFVVGVSIGSLFSDLLQPYLPEVLKPKKQEIEGKVTAKQLNQDALLVTVSTPPGAILVTFDKKVSEINLLVEKGDMITVSLHQYEPFVTNPSIIRVRKAQSQEETSESIPIPNDSPSPTAPGAQRSPPLPEEENHAEDPISF